MRSPSGISRRTLLHLLVTSGIAGLGVNLADLLASDMRPETPNLVVGPFYPLLKPLDRDADLTRVRGHRGRAAGQVIDVSGRVLNRNGEPVRGARIELWQANSHGRYAHPSDPNTAAPLDPDFQGFALQVTDRDGRYRFKTIKPGAYPGQGGSRMRAPHLHFDIQGRVDRKVTQMFFPDEPLNAQDRLFLDVPRDRQTLIATVASRASETNELALTWDITLAQG
jgi:protocatechuate 3,4-dioxygenase, beta subunit